MTTYMKILEQSEKQIRRLVELTGVSKPIAANVVQFVKCLCKFETPGIVDELIFKAVLNKYFNLTSSCMNSLVYEAARNQTTQMQELTVEDCLRCFCIFLSPKLELKLEFIFKVYDINKDGHLSWNEMYTLLRNSLFEQDTPEEDTNDQVKDMTDMVMNTVDLNKNKEVDLFEFRSLVYGNILYLELLGPCLPSDKFIKKFIELLSGKSPIEVRTKFDNERSRLLREHAPPKKAQLYPVILDLP